MTIYYNKKGADGNTEEEGWFCVIDVVCISEKILKVAFTEVLVLHYEQLIGQYHKNRGI